MATAEFEKQIFTHQNHTATYLENELSYDRLTETPPIPEANEPVTQEQQEIEDAEVAGLMDQLRNLRYEEFQHASMVNQAQVHKAGPYAKNGPVAIFPDPSDPTKSIKRPMTSDEVIKHNADKLSERRSAVISGFAEKVDEGNSSRVLARIHAEAAMLAPQAAKAATAHNDSQGATADSERAHRRSVLDLDTEARRSELHSNGQATAAVRKLEPYVSDSPKIYADTDPTKTLAQKYAAAEQAHRDNETAVRGRMRGAALLTTHAQSGKALDDARQKQFAAGRADHALNGHTYKHGGNTIRLESFADSITAIADDIGAEVIQNTEAARRALNVASFGLDGWRLGANNPTRDIEVTDFLEVARDHINQLSFRDEGRAELRERYVIQCFRQEQRDITAHANAGNMGDPITEYRSFYTDDGGIYVYTEEKLGVVLYEDGSTAIFEDDGSGKMVAVRRHSDGDIWHDQYADEQAPIDTDGMSDSQLDAEKSRTFQEWETSRDPEKKQEAAQYLDANAKRLDGHAADLTDRNAELSNGVRGIDRDVVAYRANIISLVGDGKPGSRGDADNNEDLANSTQPQATADIAVVQGRIDALRSSKKPGDLTAEDDQHIAEWEAQKVEIRQRATEREHQLRQLAAEQRRDAAALQNDIADLQRQRAGLLLDVDRNRTNIESLRSRENQDIYWLGALRSEPVPPAGSSARMGQIAMGGTMELPPHLQADGVLVWNNVVINGIHGRWTMRPDGRATHHDGNFSYTHDADGNELPPHNQIPPQWANTYYNADGTPNRTLTAGIRGATPSLTIIYNRDGSVSSIYRT